MGCSSADGLVFVFIIFLYFQNIYNNSLGWTVFVCLHFITNTYLHSYNTTTTIPHTSPHKYYIYIHTLQQLRYPIPLITNTIFTFIQLQQLRYPISLITNTNTYLHSYNYSNCDTPYLSSQIQTHIYIHTITATTIPHTSHHKYKHMFTFIQLQQLRYPIPLSTNTNTYLHSYNYSNYDTPYLSSQILYLHSYNYSNYDTPYLSSQIQTHIYIHTITATTIPHISHHKYKPIFTFIQHSNYDTPYLSSQIQTHIYIHTITATAIPHTSHHKYKHIFTFIQLQQLRYPIPLITNTNTCLHSYNYSNYDTPYLSAQIQTHIYIHTITATTIPHTSRHKYYIYIHTITATTIPHISHHKYKHIFTFIQLQQLRYPISLITNTNPYLHSYNIATTTPHTSHHKYKHIFTFIQYSNYDAPYLTSQIQTHIYIHTIPQRSITILSISLRPFQQIPWHLKNIGT